MKILNIAINNFRSIDETGIDISLHKGLNIITGENNTGKSNILIALSFLKDFLKNTNTNFTHGDYHNGITEKEIKISVGIILNNQELDEIINLMLQGSKLEDNISDIRDWLKKDMGFKFNLTVSRINRNYIPYVRMKKFYINDMGGTLHPENFLSGSHKTSHINGVLKGSFAQRISLADYEILNRRGNEDMFIPEFSFIYSYISKLFKKNFNVFEDVRQKPKWKQSAVVDSYDGAELINVLYNLYNNVNRNINQRYYSIRNEFEKLYPGLSFRAVTGDLHIRRNSTDYEVSINSCGAGLIEMLIFLTNIVDSNNKTFGIEEPELHLHPHSQRVLFEIIESNIKSNQFIVLTHSPQFTCPTYIHNHILVKEINGSTKTFQLPPNYFDKREISKLEKNLELTSRDIFFSKSVILMEGETEVGAMPIFAKKLDFDFDVNMIAPIWVGGKDNFEIFIKLLNGFDIPYIVMCDWDAVMQIGPKGIPSFFRQLYNLSLIEQKDLECIKSMDKEEKNGIATIKKELFENIQQISQKYNCYPLSTNFEGILESNYGPLIMEAKSEVGNSKPRIGRYVAEKITENDDKIPTEFKEITEALKKIHHSTKLN